MLLTSGRYSGLIQVKADFHDVDPAFLIVEETGSKVTDCSGVTLCYNQPLDNGTILSNKVIHDQLVKIANESK